MNRDEMCYNFKANVQLYGLRYVVLNGCDYGWKRRSKMTVPETKEFLEKIKSYGSILGLASIRALMRELGDPQDQLKVIHIAGTNGKGSVGRMISTAFEKAGYCCGHFSTPDVFAYKEEFQVNNVPASWEELAEVFTEVRQACERMTAAGLRHPTRFEVETAAAFCLFLKNGCDIAVIECGMGGATDATNVIALPLVSVFTSISLDHMQFLGESLAEIAAVKAGIIKGRVPVVTALQQPEAAAVLTDHAAENNSPIYIADPKAAEIVSCDASGSVFLYQSPYSFEAREDCSECGNSVPADPAAERYRIRLAGPFQVENAIVAIEVLHLVQKVFPKLTEDVIHSGLAAAYWPGRLERVSEHPEIYLDGAHNIGAALRLREAVDTLMHGRRPVFIMGVLADKEYREMIRIMFQPGDHVITVTPPDNPRALDGAALAEEIRRAGVSAEYVPEIKNAFAGACALSGADGVILAFGSLSWLKEAKEACSALMKN